MIVHNLFNGLLVQKSNIQNNSSWNLGLGPTTIIWKPLIQDWLIDVLIVMASKVEAKESKLTLQASHPWIFELASKSY